MRFSSRFGKYYLFSIILISTLLSNLMIPSAGSAQDYWAEMISPLPNQDMIGRRPSITIKFLVPPPEGSIIMLVDNMDVTRLAQITADGLEYRPIFTLPAGPHQVMLMSSIEGVDQMIPLVWSFSMRHTKMLEEASLGVEPSGVYRQAIDNQFADLPDWRFDGNIHVDSQLKEGNGFFSVETDVRYFDQQLAVLPPLREGFELAHLLVQGGYRPSNWYSTFSAGDVAISGTPLSLELDRRGGVVQIGRGATTVDIFHIESTPTIGCTDTYGLKAAQENHVQGVSVGQRLFSDQFKLNGVYYSGNDQKMDSFSVGSAEPPGEGDMLAFMAQGDFLGGRAVAFGEAAFSRFDQDISDSQGKVRDSAYRAGLRGTVDQLFYTLQYEYIGAEFQGLGNPFLPKDRKGFSGNMGYRWKDLDMQLSGSRYEDNVKRNSLLPVTVFWDAGVSMSYQRWPRFPVQLGYTHSAQKSIREPEGFGDLDIAVDSINAYLGYAGDRVNLTFGPTVSWSDDGTVTNQDTTAVVYPLSLSWMPLDVFTLSSSISLNQVYDELLDERTDTYTGSATIHWTILPEFLQFDLGGSYTRTQATNDIVDIRIADVNSRLMMSVKKYIEPYGDIRIGLEGKYGWIQDRLSPEPSEDFYAIFAVVEFSVPMKF